MRAAVNSVSLALLLAALPPGIHAAEGLSLERAGLGLKPPSAAVSPAATLAPDAGLHFAARAASTGDTVGFGGTRHSFRLGMPVRESYGGVSYPLYDTLAASLELATMDATPLSPRRYSLAGQLHAPLASGGGLSLGLAYRIYDTDPRLRSGTPLDPAPVNGYALVPVHAPGIGLGPSYQLQLHYQYNPATTFGLVLGRELETFASGIDTSAAGLRQFSFTGQHWITPSWALSYDVLSDDPGSFRLQGLRFGVRYRF